MSKTRKKTIEWLLKNYTSLFEEFGVQENDIKERFEYWKEKQSEIVEDFLWSLFNGQLLENAKQANNLLELYSKNDRIYAEMLFFRRKTEKVPANKLLKLFNANRILNNTSS